MVPLGERLGAPSAPTVATKPSFCSAITRFMSAVRIAMAAFYGLSLEEGNEETCMANRINRANELLEADQAIYYDGPHTGHVLTQEQGRVDARTWADYINVGMEHGAFDMTGLEEYMRGLLAGGPTKSGHLTPTVIVEAPVNGIDGPNVAFNAWQFRQILARGVHGILLCQAESADAVREFVRACRFPHHKPGTDKLGIGT